MNHKHVQSLAKQTMEYIKAQIKAGMTLLELRELCEARMLSLGADSFWYWNVGAFVFSGNDTTLSVSGRDYVTSGKAIEVNDIITIDLSPQIKNVWGDYARTVIIENGKAVENIADIRNTEWKNGLRMEENLHKELLRYAKPDTTFEELYLHMNEFISSSGFINLDFLGNLGHSIAHRKEDRIYIEKGNHKKLGDVDLFTFEPHISINGSVYGYKKENIYYFEDGKIKEL